MAEVDRARSLAGLDSVPCRLTLGVVPGGPSLPQPDLTEATFSKLTLSFWVKSLCTAMGSRRLVARSGTGLRFDRQH